MSAYEQTLIAAGIAPEQAARDAWANDVKWFANREHPNYGVYDPADWGGVRQAAELKYGVERDAD